MNPYRKQLICGLSLIFCYTLVTVRAQSPVFINEVFANNATFVDTYGNTPDWIELYNSSTNEINLAGMSLTSDRLTPRHWIFPEGASIRARSFYVVYCDDNLPVSPRNTGFGLSANGDAVYLYGPSTNLLDSVVFGLQVEDLSIGRLQVFNDSWYLLRPTLESANVQVTMGNPQNLRVNEWMADPASGSDWFEIYSPDSNPVAIGGWFLSNALNKTPHKYAIPALSFIGSGAQGFQKFIADDVAGGANHVNFKLSKGGDEIGLFPPTGSAAVDSVAFGAQSTGISQGFLPDGSGNRVSFLETPTPGESNYLPLANVVINEILTHTDPPLEDAIELYNPTGADVAIGGWFLSDSQSNFKKFQIPAGTLLSARGYQVFYEHQLTNTATPFTFNSSEGDTLYLSAAAGGQLTGYRTDVKFAAAANGVSFGRYTNLVGVVQYPPQRAVTLGAVNAGPLVGPVVINEIMFNPPPISGTNDNTLDEFVELHNISANTVTLYEPNEETNTWHITGGIDYVFPRGVVLPPAGYLLVVSFDPSTNAPDLASFRLRYNLDTNVPIYGPFARKLGNGGDIVELQKPDPAQGIGHINQGLVPYVYADRVEYQAGPPWPPGAVLTGNSLQRKDSFDYGDDPVNWLVAPPTAGKSNSGTLLDHDHDGLPDDWELAYGLNPNDPSDAALDSDGDGLTNLQEYASGTHPRDATSVLKLQAFRTVSDGFALRFTAEAGKSYSIQYRSELTMGSWLSLTNLSAGAQRLVELTDPAGKSGVGRYYRLVAQ